MGLSDIMTVWPALNLNPLAESPILTMKTKAENKLQAETNPIPPLVLAPAPQPCAHCGTPQPTAGLVFGVCPACVEKAHPELSARPGPQLVAHPTGANGSIIFHGRLVQPNGAADAWLVTLQTGPGNAEPEALPFEVLRRAPGDEFRRWLGERGMSCTAGQHELWQLGQQADLLATEIEAVTQYGWNGRQGAWYFADAVFNLAWKSPLALTGPLTWHLRRGYYQPTGTAVGRRNAWGRPRVGVGGLQDRGLWLTVLENLHAVHGPGALAALGLVCAAPAMPELELEVQGVLLRGTPGVGKTCLGLWLLALWGCEGPGRPYGHTTAAWRQVNAEQYRCLPVLMDELRRGDELRLLAEVSQWPAFCLAAGVGVAGMDSPQWLTVNLERRDRADEFARLQAVKPALRQIGSELLRRRVQYAARVRSALGTSERHAGAVARAGLLAVSAVLGLANEAEPYHGAAVEWLTAPDLALLQRHQRPARRKRHAGA